MTFPIDFHRHPKIARLSDAAFRAFVEANGESRLAESDGRIDAPDAEFMWSTSVLDELIQSHPTRPVMLRDGDAYVLRDYAEHQFTKADRDELSRKRAEAGAKGAAAKASNRLASAEQVLSKVQQTQAESESGLGDSKTSLRQSRTTHASDATDSNVTPTLKRISQRAGITSIPAVLEAIARHAARTVTPEDALTVAYWILDKKSGPPPRAPQRYVTGAISRNPIEIQQFIDERGIAL
tara:strand:- start:3273 stop:3986 length:714 start_codon:yes stop_codon:yes gene_type:complete